MIWPVHKYRNKDYRTYKELTENGEKNMDLKSKNTIDLNIISIT
jgi:hypothetical protein